MSDDADKWLVPGIPGLEDPKTRRACLAIKELRWAGADERLREIASALRAGCAHPIFLHLLAEQIDPDVDWSSTGTKLIVSRPRQPKGPPKKPDERLDTFLTVQIVAFGEKAEAVYAEAKARFGVSRTTCTEMLSKGRKFREMYGISDAKVREHAHKMRQRGDPDYQPLSG